MFAKIRHWAVLNPLARLALAAVTGIIFADYGFGREHPASLPLLAAASSLLIFLRPRWLPLEIPAALVFASIHQFRLDETTDHPLRAELRGKDRVEATVIGYLTPGAEAGMGGDGSRQEVSIEASSIQMPGEGRRVTGATTLHGWMTAKERLPPAGTYEILGRLRLPKRPTNPGQFDSAAHSLRQGFVADFDVRSVRLIKRDRLPVHASFLKAAQRSREWIEHQLEAGIEGEEQPLALIQGMALGVTDEASAEIQRPFRNTGTLHVFSVSGLHVALISTIGWMFLSVLGVKRTTALAILIPAVFAYAFITGWRPSAARAAIMVTVFMTATMVDRKSRLQNSLGTAALALLASDTHQLFTAGFQLSFGVLYAIALLNGPLVNLCRRWTELDPFLPPQIASWRQQRWSQFKTWLASTVSVSSAATVGSLPLMLWHFGLATPIAVLANCLLIPLAFVVLATVCVSVLFATVHLGSALALSNNANWLFAKLMLGGAVLFSKVPGGYFTWQPATHATSRPPIELTILNLPYGEAAQHLRVGDAHWLLDTGSKRAFSRIVQPLLQKQGADTLDGLILSHSDIEHVGGAVRAFSEHGCGLACLGILEPWRHESGASGLKRFLAAQTTDNAPLRFLAEGEKLEFGPRATASVLYPSRRDLHDKGDDRALVLLIELDGFRILWCNDIGLITEKTLMERNLLKSLRCDVLIRNQHVTDYSALPEFLLAARPKIIVTSNVPFLAEQTMPPSLAEYARKKRGTVLDQDVQGAVTLAVGNDQLTAMGFVTGQTVTLNKRR
jgi:competence protein ComEC